MNAFQYRLDEEVELDKARNIVLASARKVAAVFQIDPTHFEFTEVCKDLVKDVARLEHAERQLEDMLEALDDDVSF